MSPSKSREVFGHPPGLFLLFLVEVWERFSYYGFRGLLVLYLISPTSGMRHPPPGAPENFNPGAGWQIGEATIAYLWYTSAVYATTMLGGYVADKFIGPRRAVSIGGLLIILGHVALAASQWAGSARDAAFVFGLALVAIGTGFLKPNATRLVGDLYSPRDMRRNGAYGIYYTGINLGSALQAFVVGTVGELVGWHIGFAFAALAMLIGLGLYLGLQGKLLGPANPPRPAGVLWSAGAIAGSIIASLLVAGAFELHWLRIIQVAWDSAWYLFIAGAGVGVAVLIGNARGRERAATIAVIVLALLSAGAWVLLEQAGSSLTLITDVATNRNVGQSQIPVTWFQFVNPALITLAGWWFPGWISGKWKAMDSQAGRLMFGYFALLVGYLYIGACSGAADIAGSRINWSAIVIMYVLHTVGELAFSPTGLAYVSSIAPGSRLGFLLGVYFLHAVIGNFLAGNVARLLPDPATPTIQSLGLSSTTWFLALLCLIAIVGGVATLFLRRWITVPPETGGNQGVPEYLAHNLKEGVEMPA